MKAKYYLTRLLCERLQFSENYFTSYKEAIKARERQVNPSQWLIVVNPTISSYAERINLESSKIQQGQLFDKAWKLTNELSQIMFKLSK
jgi:hypothetical protein